MYVVMYLLANQQWWLPNGIFYVNLRRFHLCRPCFFTSLLEQKEHFKVSVMKHEFKTQLSKGVTALRNAVDKGSHCISQDMWT